MSRKRINSYCEKIATMSTYKERQAKQRAKLKQDKKLYQAYLDRDKKRNAVKRAVLKSQMSASQLEEHRVSERLRLRKYREKKRLVTPCAQNTQSESSQSSTSTPYRTSESLGKATKRAQVSLPSSPPGTHHSGWCQELYKTT